MKRLFIKQGIIAALVLCTSFATYARTEDPEELVCPDLATISTANAKFDTVHQYNGRSDVYSVYSYQSAFFFNASYWYIASLVHDASDFNDAIVLAKNNVKSVTMLDKELSKHEDDKDLCMYYSASGGRMSVMAIGSATETPPRQITNFK